MSRETQEWLDNNVLVGFTEKRGNAWHWREGTTNHYPGAIPIEDVRRRLFSWQPEKVDMFYEWNGKFRGYEGQAIIVRNDTGVALGKPTDSFNPQAYGDWLLTNTANMLDDDIQIGSAGMLKRGSVGWVQIELTENQVVEGVTFRPTILAYTSLDGSLAPTHKPVNTIVVCDNTMAAAIGEKVANMYSIKQTKNSRFNVTVARDKIGIALSQQADAFTAEIQSLTSQSVTDKQFADFLGVVNPVPETPGPLATQGEKNSYTRAENKREALTGMWVSDPRVSMWKNTVWGVLQLMNTYEQHERSFKGQKVESQMMSLFRGTSFAKDNEVLTDLNKVLQNA